MTLRRIPVVDARAAVHPAAHAASSRPDEVAAILAATRRRYTAAGLALGDALSRRWLARNATPLAAEIGAVAQGIGQRGAHLLNLSYEWGCSSGVLAREAPVMLRVLDWANLDALGETLCVIRQKGAAGEWLHVGWPGLAGAITALAPGRFAVAINQPPLPLTRLGAAARSRSLRRLGLAADWLVSRPAAWRARTLPPAHLLRIACDTAPDFHAALALLREAPVAAPVTYTLAGTQPGEAAILERSPDRTALRQGSGIAAANHWSGLDQPGAPRWRQSVPRQACMEALLAGGAVPDRFAWLKSPLLNEGTRLAAVMHPAEGRLDLVAQAGERRVSEILTVAA